LDDPVQQGKVECLRVWTFPRERSWDRRLLAAERAADALEPHAGDPLGVEVLGILTLHAALGAAVVQRPQVVSHWLSEADQLAARVPDDIVNVQVLGLAAAVRDRWSRFGGGRGVAVVAERGFGDDPGL